MSDDMAYAKENERHVESLELETILGLISERVTHVRLDWADGCCRAEMRAGRRNWVGRGPRASVALARAMIEYDRIIGLENETYENPKRGPEQGFPKVVK
jgi:hypothetical protein